MDAKRKIFFVVIIGVILLLPCFVSAEDKYGLTDTARKTKLMGMTISKSSPEALAAQIVTVVLGFVGTVFFILVLYGGITWMTAMGSSEKVTQAKNILQTAFIGLVIVAASYALATFIFSRLGGEGGAVNCTGTCTPAEITCPSGDAGGVCAGGQHCCK